MDFSLDKKHEMARTLFKEFAETEVKPLAQEVDETEEFPMGTVKKMAKAGFMGIPVPKEYGGQGCDPLTYVMCVEELSKVCATTGVIVSAHTSLCIDPILTYGTEEQKQKYVAPLAKGEKLGAFALTEPGAGTDSGRTDQGSSGWRRVGAERFQVLYYQRKSCGRIYCDRHHQRDGRQERKKEKELFRIYRG